MVWSLVDICCCRAGKARFRLKIWHVSLSETGVETVSSPIYFFQANTRRTSSTSSSLYVVSCLWANYKKKKFKKKKKIMSFHMNLDVQVSRRQCSRISLYWKNTAVLGIVIYFLYFFLGEKKIRFSSKQKPAFHCRLRTNLEKRSDPILFSITVCQTKVP